MVTVKVPEQYLKKVMDILERHAPVDIDERAASYDFSAVDQMARPPLMDAPLAPASTDRTQTNQTISLAEETLTVGKRAVNLGTTRVRRYVIETPVEEQVRLRDESVSIERRSVTDGRPITDANFTDKVVAMVETKEEAVVSKTARIKEELVIHKDTTERTETIRDTVRREEAEITKEAMAPGNAATTGLTPRPLIDPDESKI